MVSWADILPVVTVCFFQPSHEFHKLCRARVSHPTLLLEASLMWYWIRGELISEEILARKEKVKQLKWLRLATVGLHWLKHLIWLYIICRPIPVHWTSTVGLIAFYVRYLFERTVHQLRWKSDNHVYTDRCIDTALLRVVAVGAYT